MRWHSLSRGATEGEHKHSVRHLRLAPESRAAVAHSSARRGPLRRDLHHPGHAQLAEVAGGGGSPRLVALLAPLPRLLHAPRRVRDNHGTSWEQFAARYRADLDALPLWLQNAYVLKLGKLLQRYPSVTLLSAEPSRGLPEGQAHTQRRVLWHWLVE